MTQRAAEREEYKKKKRLPAPEVPRPKGKHKPEKNIFLQRRYKPSYVEKINKRADEYGIKEEIFNGKVFKTMRYRITCNNWETVGKYADREVAEEVLRREKLHFHEYIHEHEYRIISKNELKNEKETKMIMTATESCLKKDWDTPEENKAWEKL
jgi:hypothetical protein